LLTLTSSKKSGKLAKQLEKEVAKHGGKKFSEHSKRTKPKYRGDATQVFAEIRTKYPHGSEYKEKMAEVVKRWNAEMSRRYDQR